MEGILGKGDGLKDPSKNKEFLGKTFAEYIRIGWF
jgi:hypothetical protein